MIDPTTNQVVMKIPNLEAAHGVAFSPDGARAYHLRSGQHDVGCSH